jgi:hypothetical protein
MTAEQFGLDRVDSLHNIASAVPAAGEKDQRRKNERQSKRPPATEEEKSIVEAEEGMNVSQEQHVIDFEA